MSVHPDLAKSRHDNLLKMREKQGLSTSTTPPTPEKFPVDALPWILADYVKKASLVLDTDHAFLGPAMLPPLAAAIGNYAVVEMSDMWTVPSVLWTAIVAPSGSMKSPVIDAAEKSAQDQDYRLLQEYKESNDEWDKESKTPKPIQERALIADITVEGAAVILSRSPRGLLKAHDELSGFMGSFNAYKKTGSDVSNWLTMYGARTLTVDRKTGDHQSIKIRRANVSVVGAITPDGMKAALKGLHWTDGLAPRFMLSMPPTHEKEWNPQPRDHTLRDRIDDVFESLYGLKLKYDEESGKQQPKTVKLDIKAEKLWKKFIDPFNRRVHEATGYEASRLAKLEEITVRLALVIHFTRLVSPRENIKKKFLVDDTSLQMAIDLQRWFDRESLRVTNLLMEDDDQTEQREVLAWWAKQDGSITANDLAHGPRKYRGKSDLAEIILDTLVREGFGTAKQPKSTETGGRPTRVYTLKTK